MKIHKINVKGSRQRCKILLGFDVLKTLKKYQIFISTIKKNSPYF